MLFICRMATYYFIKVLNRLREDTGEEKLSKAIASVMQKN